MRNAGVLLPVFSLPGKYGIGTMGKEAYRFADKLKRAGQSLWQILPLGPTGYGDSPYQSFSTFAGNPYFIDLEAFPEDILKKKDLLAAESGEDPEHIDYGKLYTSRFALLYQVYQVDNYLGLEQRYPDFSAFCREQEDWLQDYGLFMALKEAHDGAPWYDWEPELRNRREEALSQSREKLGDRIRFYCWLQYHFEKQWKALKDYVNSRGIRLIGDLPIYVALDSADAWAHPELFQMDESRRPSWVAGVPPDAFSATGQLWGNPVYDWDRHRQQGYGWWIRRIRRMLQLVDVMRIDHFRGFESYYCVPAGDETAERGVWEKGPGMELFRALRQQLGELPIIAEDLGFLTDAVRQLLSDSGYPGMKVLEFAFNAKEESDYLPHRWPKNCVAYTGTHDNQTLKAWFEELSEEDRAFALDYLGLLGRSPGEWNEYAIRMAFASGADTVIVPFQDWKGLGREARINEPSTVGGNWSWRMQPEAFDEELIEKMRHLTRLYGRQAPSQRAEKA